MDFNEWEKRKQYEEGRGAYQSLYDAVGATVRSQYEGIENYACDSCYKTFFGGNGQCPECGSWITHKI